VSRLLVPLVLVSICALLVACGGGSETHKIGTSEVTVSGESDSVIDAMREVAEQAPYEKWALDCIIEQFEKVITPAQEEKLEGASEKEVGEFLLPHLPAINRACERPGRHFFNPHATEAELALVRSAQTQGLRLILKAAEVPASERKCVEDEFEALPGPQVVAIIEADEGEREAMFSQLAQPCIGR
jgi:hypothetical protein